jgi:hypothetical protein
MPSPYFVLFNVIILIMHGGVHPRQVGPLSLQLWRLAANTLNKAGDSRQGAVFRLWRVGVVLKTPHCKKKKSLLRHFTKGLELGWETQRQDRFFTKTTPNILKMEAAGVIETLINTFRIT